MTNGAGIPEKTAMLISGHKTRSILDRYSIVVEKDIHAAGGEWRLISPSRRKFVHQTWSRVHPNLSTDSACWG